MKGWDEVMKRTDENEKNTGGLTGDSGKILSPVQELEWFREMLLGKGASENTVRADLASVRRFYESHKAVTVEALQESESASWCRSRRNISPWDVWLEQRGLAPGYVLLTGT